ncbi:MAG: hypothetical protein Q9223_003601, partial [Gallowayella weberi]
DFIPYVPSDDDEPSTDNDDEPSTDDDEPSTDDNEPSTDDNEPSTRTQELDIEQLSYSKDHSSSTHPEQMEIELLQTATPDPSEHNPSPSPEGSGDSSYDDSSDHLLGESGSVQEQHSVSTAHHDVDSMDGTPEYMDVDEEFEEQEDNDRPASFLSDSTYPVTYPVSLSDEVYEYTSELESQILGLPKVDRLERVREWLLEQSGPQDPIEYQSLIDASSFFEQELEMPDMVW